jgi:hypothetical protein
LTSPKSTSTGRPSETDDDVLGLDVPVDHAASVAVGQRVQQLAGPVQHLGLRQGPVGGDQVGQAVPLHELHHQVGVAAFLKEVADAHQVGMAQLGQDGGLLMELAAEGIQHLGGQPGLGGHLFDGYGDVEAIVPGPVDGAHSTLPQQGHDPITVLEDLS